MDIPRLARKITITLFLAMSFGSAGFIVVATVNSIVGAQISGNPAWAGLPAAVFTLGMALSSYLLGFAMDRFGRRLGMVIGLLPVVGVPLPLISYGGTSIVTIMASFGILMAIHTNRKLLPR